jgi:hypothetical protein
MANELFAGMVFMYVFIALPFVVIDEMYAPGDDDPDSMTEWG